MYDIETKVVPIDKSIGVSLDRCKEWKIGKEQGYLYVVGCYEEGYILSAYNHRRNGSLYAHDDVVELKGETKEWKGIRDGLLVRDLEIDVEWHKENIFLGALKRKEDILCLADMDNQFVKPLNLAQVKRIYEYLGKVIDYCNSNLD